MGKFKKIVVSVLIVAFLLGAATYVYKTVKLGSGHQKYYAVFLTNEQVYFGQLTSRSDDWLSLANVHYLQANQNQPANNDDVSLIRLGGELHGPTDTMEIPVSNILFIEELKADSKVVQAIAQTPAP